MKLFGSSRSPFTRKVLLAFLERGIEVECVPVVVAFDKPTPGELAATNPLGQLPTLVTDDGMALYDSSVILDWLFSELSTEDRMVARRREALADGICEKTVRRLIESGRENVAAVEALNATLNRALDVLEAGAGDWLLMDYGLIAVGNALAYVDFRASALEWRIGRPNLTAWEAAFAERASSRAVAFGTDFTAPSLSSTGRP